MPGASLARDETRRIAGGARHPRRHARRSVCSSLLAWSGPRHSARTVHLSLDADLPAADAAAALAAAFRDRGLRVARIAAVPRGPGARPVFVVEIADPLPDVPSDAFADGATRTAYPLSVFEIAPGRSRLSTLHPTTLVDLLGHPEAADAARRFEETLHAVFAAAAHGGDSTRPSPRPRTP